MESNIDGVSNESLMDAAFEINQVADHASWTDKEYADELRSVAESLRENVVEESHD